MITLSREAEKYIESVLSDYAEEHDDPEKFREQLECECAIDQLIEMITEELQDTPMEHLGMMVNYLHRMDVIEAYRGTKSKVADMLSECLEHEYNSRLEDG